MALSQSDAMKERLASAPRDGRRCRDRVGAIPGRWLNGRHAEAAQRGPPSPWKVESGKTRGCETVHSTTKEDHDAAIPTLRRH
jgi:hypothetical protein